MPKPQRRSKKRTKMASTKSKRIIHSRTGRTNRKRKLSFKRRFFNALFPKNSVTWGILSVFVISILGFVGYNIQQNYVSYAEPWAHTRSSAQIKRTKKINAQAKKKAQKAKNKREIARWSAYSKAHDAREKAKKKAKKAKKKREIDRWSAYSKAEKKRKAAAAKKKREAKKKKDSFTTAKLSLPKAAKERLKKAEKRELAAREKAFVTVSMSRFKDRSNSKKKLTAKQYNAQLNKKNKKPPTPLGKKSCENRGFTWNTHRSSCDTNFCKNRKDKVIIAKYNYCSKNVTKTISKTDCRKLGRIWLAYNGCARATGSVKKASICRDGSDYTGGSKVRIDYCGNRKAVAKTVRLVDPRAANNSGSRGANKSAYGNYLKNCGRWCKGKNGCVYYVYYRLEQAGYKKEVSGPLGNGGYVAGNLHSKHGWSLSNKPTAGAVFSDKSMGGGYGHTGIVHKVNKDGSILLAENLSGRAEQKLRHVSASEAAKWQFAAAPR